MKKAKKNTASSEDKVESSPQDTPRETKPRDADQESQPLPDAFIL